MFVRHLTVEIASFPSELPPAHELAELILAELPEHPKALAVQTWTDARRDRRVVLPPRSRRRSRARGRRDALRAEVGRLVLRVREGGAARPQPARGQPVGLAGRADAAGSWDERVSRSEFKLEEAIQTFDLRAARRRQGGRPRRLPGGWTRILRQHGQEVWSVDPGLPRPRELAADRGIHHVATTAGRFFADNRVRFDVVVNDMRMDQVLSARVMLDAVAHLRRGGPRDRHAEGRRQEPARRRPPRNRRPSHGVRRTAARQLHHNRNEITVVAARR